jgi:hypothetical protein
MNDVYKTTARHPGRPMLLLGILLAVAAPVLYVALLLGAGVLIAPWYTPIVGTLGVALIVLALVRSRSAWRWTAVVACTVFVAFQWFALLAMQTPAYTGPVKEGESFPEFASTLADGSTFTRNDLNGDRNTVMVFFRGHW